jgi:flagellar hook-basal body complex protein FliE
MMGMEEFGAIGAIGATVDADGLLAPTAVRPSEGGFAHWFTQEVGQVNQSVATVQNDIRKLATGEAQSLHEVMIHMEEAKLSFQLLAQVRTRLLEAYQEVMRTQV